MKTIRLLLGLTGLLTALAITASPAAAEFEANQPNTTQGPLQLEGGTLAVFEGGGSEFKCAKLTNGAWHIQTKFTKIVVTAGVTKIVQDATKRGAHQELTGQFEECVSGANAVTVNATCALQVEQKPGGVFTGSVVSLCQITGPFGACEVKIPAGNPNTQLASVTVANIATGEKIVSTVEGITSFASNGLCGTNTNAAKFKATAIAHSEKVI